MNKISNSLTRNIRTWHFLAAFVLLVPLSALLLRQNNLTMIELRGEVLRIDEETGDIKKVEPALNELGNYVLNHMNTDMGRLELPGTFNTAVKKIQKQVQASGSANAKVYTKAQEVCEDPSILLTARAQCIQDYITSNAKPGTDAELNIEFPDKSLYSYSFSSPAWSPDLAGFSVLLAILTAIVLVILVLTRHILPFVNRFIDKDPLE